MNKIAQENPNKTILVCSHGIAIEAFLRSIVQIPFNIESKKFSQKNTSINIVFYDEKSKKFFIKELCETEHLKHEIVQQKI